MRIKLYLITGMAVLALAGCQTGSGDSGGDGSSSRSEYMTSVKEQMNTLDKKMDDLADKSKGLKDDAKAQADDAMAALRRERKVLGEKYDQLMSASQDAWQGAKDGFSSAWSQMQSSLDAAKSKFN